MNCTKCHAHIVNIVFIDGLPYGSDCAETLLGMKLPKGFTGDGNKYKADTEKIQAELSEAFNQRREITSKHWPDFIKLSRAHLKARKKANETGKDWDMNFISSIAQQAGFNNLTCEGIEFDTMEDAEKGWKSYMGSFPYLDGEIKGIDGLSAKQQQYLTTILDRYACVL